MRYALYIAIVVVVDRVAIAAASVPTSRQRHQHQAMVVEQQKDEPNPIMLLSKTWATAMPASRAIHPHASTPKMDRLAHGEK